MVSLKLNNGSDDLLLDGPAIKCVDWTDLYKSAPSRGSNLTVSQTDGTVLRDRDRGELAVTLTVLVNGGWNLAGTKLSSGMELQARKLMRHLSEFVENGSQRTLTVTLDDDDVFEADASFEEFGQVRAESASIWRVSMLLTVADGILSEVAE